MSRMTFGQLNLVDTQVVRESGQLLGEVQQTMLNAAFSPYKLANPAFGEQYYQTAGMVINAAPTFMQRYCFCLMNGKSCNMRKYCPRCAQASARKLVEKFGHCHRDGEWQFLTLSFNGSVAVQNLCSCNWVWDITVQAFKQASLDWAAAGGVYVEELKILSFLPTTVMPHAHALLNASEVSESQVQDLEEAVNQVLAREMSGSDLTANIQVKAIEDEDHFTNALGYLVKAMDFTEPYRSAWTQRVEEGSHTALQLNSDVTDGLRGISVSAAGRTGIRYTGNMSVNRKRGYIGRRGPNVTRTELLNDALQTSLAE